MRAGGGGGGLGEYFKNQYLVINVGMIGQTSSEDTRVLEEFETRGPQTAGIGKCVETANLTITTLFCIILNILRSNHQAHLFGSWVCVHSAYSP